MDYVIAIPSHRRAAMFGSKTLDYLKRTGVPLERVHLFLSDDQDVREYHEAGVLDGLTHRVCPGALNATDKFNAIHFGFEPGTRVFVLEDDVELIGGDPGVNGSARPLLRLDGMIQRGFTEVGERGLFGICPHSNVFFFNKNLVTRDLRLIVAHAFGFVATCDPALAVTQPSKTDYERTLRYYVAHGEVVRLNHYGVKTNSYTQRGGMQADHTRDERAALEGQAVAFLCAKWPHLIERNTRKKSLFAEVRFKAHGWLQPDALQEYQHAVDAQTGLR